jgi:hypothetical protein
MTLISLDAMRIVKDVPELDLEACARALASPIEPPAEHDLVVLPEDDCVGAYGLMRWYWHEAPTDDGDIHAALYVARKFGLGFADAWVQLSDAYGEYNSRYSHN